MFSYISKEGIIFMEAGKLNWDELKYIIDKNKTVKREEVLVSNGIGEDCAILDFHNSKIVLSTDPITGATKNLGKLAVNINCNDIASSGAEPVGIMVTILAPLNSTIQDIQKIMEDIGEECRKINVEIIGGHTEVTEAVNKMVVSCTVIGKTNNPISTKGAKVGDKIIITKTLGIEGSSILVNEKEEELKKVLSEEEILEAKGFSELLSVIEEGKIASKFNVSSMHDVTEGGILGAIWEMAKASNVGFIINEKELPIRNVTKKICEFFNIDCLRLISSGSMVIVTSDGEKIIEELKVNNIEATLIGEIISKEKGIVIDINGEEREVDPPERDELFKII